MTRPIRIEYPGAWYHVMNRGRRKERIFFCDEDREYFLSLLAKCMRLYGLEVHAYSLMPNHYHLIVRTPRGNLSRIIRHLNGVYTQRVNRIYKYEGSLFRGRFKSILIEEEIYLLELVRYIHRNPVKAGLVERIVDHRWTSHRAYMRPQDRPRWLVVNGVLERFSEHENEALKELNLFVKKTPPRDLEKRLDSFVWPSILSGEAFKEKMKRVLLGKKLDFKEVSNYNEYCVSISAGALLTRVAEKYEVDETVLCAKRSRIHAYQLVRRAFVYVCREMLQLKSREIANALGGVSRTIITNNYALAIRDKEKGKGCIKELLLIERVARKMLKLSS